MLLSLLSSCEKPTADSEVTIGFSQAMATDDWRKQMNSSIQIEASLHQGTTLLIEDANNSVERQIADIEKFVAAKVDLIIVSPIQSRPLTAIVQKTIAEGIPVLIVDRKIEGENYTAYIGADNIEVGRNAAKYIVANRLGSGKIIQIEGLKGSSPAFERSLGFSQIINEESSMQIVETIEGNWEKESVKEPLKKILQQHPDVEYIFAHNDRMALSAWETARTMGLENKIKFVGVDGLNTPSGGIQLVKEGVLEATILYPTGGNEALKLALKIINNEPFAKNNILNTIVINDMNAEIMENQLDKIEQQQAIVNQQQHNIRTQEIQYASQTNMLWILTLLLAVILSLAIYSIYSTVVLSRKKKELECTNKTIVEQKDEIERIANIATQHHEAKLNFFTGLSHEFKTPITLIMSYVESLIENDKIKDSKLIEEVKLIYNNSNRLLRLITQLLDFRKIEESKFLLRASKTNLYDFSKEIMNNFRAEATRRNIDFQLVCEHTELSLYFDVSLIDKVYYNLLSNALKFTPDNGKISITIREMNNAVKISFKDSGIGIPEAEADLVFNPFFRASNNSNNSSGIGLHLSKEFILLHKGQIEVKSKHGTEFIVTLPKGINHLEESELIDKRDAAGKRTDFTLEAQGIPDFQPSTSSEVEKFTLLIIEDNFDLVFFLQNKLSAEYDIYSSDGSDAIEKAFAVIPDVIICDINLASTNGFDISVVLKKDLRTSHIPIIMLTALANKESVIKGLQSGVDQYLTKPFSLAVLKNSITNLLFNREKLRYYYTNNIYRVEADSNFGFPEQTFLHKMNAIVSANLDNSNFSVEDLAEKLHVSRIQLYRKVKAILGISISDHINNVRLEKAAELLKRNDMNISEIAYAIGFSTPNYFSTAFKNKFGISPKEYKQKV